MAFPIRTIAQLPLILRGFRKQKRLTQAALAAQLGMSQQSYAQLEANPAVVSVERLLRVLQALRVELNLVPTAPDLPATSATSSLPASVTPLAPSLPARPAVKGRTKPGAPGVDAEAMARIMRENW